jgi:microcystin-dependent protein
MADATTPNYGFTLPTVGLDRDVWGDLLNANWTKADTLLQQVASQGGAIMPYVQALVVQIKNQLAPVGSLMAWPTHWNAPYGYAPCDGWALSRTDYAQLFAVIGTIFGAGDGSTTFNLPNYQDTVLAHRGGTFGEAARYGELSHPLAESENGPHYHVGTTDYVGDHAHSVTEPDLSLSTSGGPYTAVGLRGSQTGNAGNHSHNFYTSYSGAGIGHNNVQPTTGVFWMIKIVPFAF